jgi:protein KTI12
MPCLIVTGNPCAGKSELARKLQERALQHSLIDKVVIINEESACPDHTKNQCYETSLTEKKTRAALKSAFDRAVGASGKKTLVILDSLNYIKGFRYELHCISKAVGERHGVLWVLNRLDVCQEWNSKLPADEAYQPSALVELAQRYEPPDERNRWDRPLYVVDVAPTRTGNAKSEALKNSVYNMHALGESMGETPVSVATAPAKKPAKSAFKKSAFTRKAKAETNAVHSTEDSPMTPSESTPISVETSSATQDQAKSDSPGIPTAETKSLEQQLDEILDSFLLKVQPLKEGMSTRQNIAEDANVLQEMDSITQRLVSALASAQSAPTGGKLQVATNGMTFIMDYKRPIALTELRRLRKQYLQWVALHPPEDSCEQGIAKSFLSYIEAQL